MQLNCQKDLKASSGSYFIKVGINYACYNKNIYYFINLLDEYILINRFIRSMHKKE